MTTAQKITAINILVTEDDIDDQYLIKQILARIPIESHVQFVNNGAQALTVINTQPHIDLLILDLNMPIMNGFEVLEELNKLNIIDHLPTVVFSTSTANEDKIKAIELGAKEYICKPSNIELLDDVFSSVLMSCANKGHTITPISKELQSIKHTSGTINLLYIEDDIEDHYLLRGVLNQNKKFKCNITFSKNLEEAESALFDNKIDIIILDLNLGMDSGIQTLHQCVQISQSTPIIVLTGQSSEVDEESFIRSGATDYILKSELNTTLLTKTIRFALERAKLHTKFEQLSKIDALTSLNNRNSFYQYLEFFIEQEKRNNNGLALVFIDLDDFKPVNDNFGHAVGDELLYQFSKRLKENLRGSDLVARYGGDEFAMILTNYKNEENLINVIKRKQKKLIEPYDIHIQDKIEQITIGVTMGVKQWNKDLTIRMFVNEADEMMYKGKTQGKNKITY